MALAPTHGLRVVCIGDVHGEWDADRDAELLARLSPDLVVAVGDFDNERSAIPKALSRLPFAKALLLGNHDAWTSSKTGKVGPQLQKSFDSIKDCDAGYTRLQWPAENLDGVVVVGARPLSWGGSNCSPQVWDLLKGLYGVASMDESTSTITDLLLRGSPMPHDLIIVAHNGPLGLGSSAESICGRDWQRPATDWGDGDLRDALATAEACGTNVPLCVFGHMHAKCRNGKRREMVVQRGKTVFVNCAEVPRHRSDGASHFTVVELDRDAFGSRLVATVESVWVGGESGMEAVSLYAAANANAMS